LTDYLLHPPRRTSILFLPPLTVLLNMQREYYETTGKITRSAGEDFMDKFRGGDAL